MIEQITKGIKISIETEFEGTFYKEECIHYAFSYEIVIENQSHEVAQLIARKWTIMEALNENEIVIGEGVVGEKPILLPGDVRRDCGDHCVGRHGRADQDRRLLDFRGGHDRLHLPGCCPFVLEWRGRAGRS